MSMSNEEWAEHQRQGLHLRPDQQTEAHKRAQRGEQATQVADNDKLTQIVALLSSIKSMIKFFVVLAVLTLIFDVLNVVLHSAH